ncbi:unnamed protein product [Meloidogyne enterolobii]|uniref:Uncharacterized protein n=1 Tax=Meloidogyne enterolobii TaxID=390850 RepID=A0ACB1A871_MELEN
MFALVDFGVFGIFLLLSLFVGLYHGIGRSLSSKSEQQPQQNSKTGDFLDGGRRLPVFPVCLSLLTTFVSGIGLLGVPAEIYTKGSGLFIYTMAGTLAFPIIGIFFIPIFYKIKCLNAYEYFEMRFNSRTLRRIATLIFTLNTLIYMAVVIYAPSIALSGVTSLPLWPFILLVGSVSTFYTAAGGIKAVIWTDTLQASFIYLGLGIIIVKGTIEAGGFGHVLQINSLTGRFAQGFILNPSILQYGNLWLEIFGGITNWICIYGLNQMAMQRYCSMPSLGHAHRVLNLTIPANIIIQLMITYIGFLMVAFFQGCDPVALKEVKTMDQLTILMANRIFEGIPGLPGLFLATIFSATLSTASSGINSLTAVLWEDFLKDSKFGQKLSNNQTSILMKLISVFFGILATSMAFACSNFGGIFQIILTTLGAISGPLVGLFFLGIFFPRANKFGAFIGLTIGISVMIILCILSNINQPYKNFVITTGNLKNNFTSVGCLNYDDEVENLKRKLRYEEYSKHNNVNFRYGNPESLLLSRLSPFAYSLLVM